MSFALSFVLLACAPTTDTADTADGGDAGVCVSGSTWNGGNEESPKMNPGEACIACHTAEHEGPDYVAAGTVFTAYDEPDDCNGAEGAVVRLTDAEGTTFEATANEAGNFYFSARSTALVAPYVAEVEFADGTVAAMSGEQDDGDCNGCHTAAGSGGAPGRIAHDAAE